MKKYSCQLNTVFSAVSLVMCLSFVHADEISANEAEVNIWVDNASLNLFVKQLANISGKTPQIDGVLPGIISGRFNGSVKQTLNTLSDQYPVLFDVEGDVLRAVDKSAISNVSIAMTDVALDDVFKSELDDNLLPGNDIEFREDSIRVSGHPSFVKRSASRITAELADTEAQLSETSVVDAASNELVEDIRTDEQSDERVVTVEQGPRPILEVDDIPGFNTF